MVRHCESKPWDYGFVEGYAKFTMFLAVLGTGISGAGLVFAMIVCLGSADHLPPNAVPLAVVGGLFGAGGLVLALLAVVFQVSLVLLAVDMGRNLRKIRANTQR